MTLRFETVCTTPSASRQAIINGVVLFCLVLATLGLGELWAGHVGPGILLAVVTELLAAVALAIARAKDA
ncbi:hypothetical protein [Ottowia sp.]|uniref:hypothetical protein n=1 Tax=Ottowia sp. TaxID=1898956 RepID=UPI003A84156A